MYSDRGGYYGDRMKEKPPSYDGSRGGPNNQWQGYEKQAADSVTHRKPGRSFYGLRTTDKYAQLPAHQVPARSVVKSFFQSTTAQGIPHAFAAHGWCKVIFWLVITAGALGGWAFNMWWITSSYLEYDSYMTIDIKKSVELDFPAITICNQNILQERIVRQNHPNILRQLDGRDSAKKAGFQDPRKARRQQGGKLQGSRINSVDRENVLHDFVATLNDSTKEEWGHQFSQMFYDCSYDGYRCSESGFVKHFNWQYGNCFTFNWANDSSDNVLESIQAGPNYGLALVLGMVSPEYLPTTQKAGIRLVIHDQKVKLLRLNDSNFDECYDTTLSTAINDNVFMEEFPWTGYSMAGCQKTCLQRHIMTTCKCFDYRFPNTGAAFSSVKRANKPCSRRDTTQYTCMTEIQDQFKNGSLSCPTCVKPCTQTYYELQMSQSTWPSNAYKSHLLDELRGAGVRAPPVTNPNATDQEKNEFIADLIHLTIYYQDLNYETITENAAYEIGQFISDFGGAVGLWVGASVITVVEFGELFFDLLIVCCATCCCAESSPKRRPRRRGHPNNGYHGEPRFAMPPPRDDMDYRGPRDDYDYRSERYGYR